MIVAPSTRPPASVDQLIEPRLAARLDRLDLLSRKMLAGKLPGERRSKRRGRSVEFDDFRQYVPGDDLRHIDWNVYARLDRLFVKLFREEQDLSLHLVLDASASMHAGTPSKLAFAHTLAMALAYVGLVNQNRVAVSTFGGGGGLTRLAPCRGRTNLHRVGAFLLSGLNTPLPLGASDPGAAFTGAMRTLAAASTSRGITVLLSDFLVPGGCEAGIAYLGAASIAGLVDAYALHVLSPGELDPAREREAGLFGDLRLTDAESGKAAEVTVTPHTLRRYRVNLAAYNATLREQCLSKGIAHILVPSDTSIDQLVIGSLRKGGMLR